MTYGEYTKTPERKLIGRKAKLTKKLYLQSGLTFQPGSVVTITRKFGGLSVEGVACPVCGVGASATRVRWDHLELLPEGTPYSRAFGEPDAQHPVTPREERLAKLRALSAPYDLPPEWGLSVPPTEWRIEFLRRQAEAEHATGNTILADDLAALADELARDQEKGDVKP